MLGSYGLRTYIWNNRLKSIALLAGFPFLLFLICFGFALLISAWSDPDVADGIANAFRLTPKLVPLAVFFALVWFVVAWFANQKIVDAITGAGKIHRRTQPRLYNILETLCISRGITMPALRVIESPALNAFASGVHKGQYTVTVTRGLLDALDDSELEAVLAHELTHIENRDVQLLVIAAIFVGIISLVGDMIVRGPRLLLTGARSGGGIGWGGSSRSSSSSSRSSSKSGGGGGAIVLILIAVAIFLFARVMAIALRMAMSRKREFLADAGAAELTKNPDAMIRALRKIEGHSDLPAPSQIQEMYLDHPRARGLAGLFSTHPPIDARIAALERFAGGREIPPPTQAPPVEPSFGTRVDGPSTSDAPSASDPSSASPPDGPWGAPVDPWGKPPSSTD